MKRNKTKIITRHPRLMGTTTQSRSLKNLKQENEQEYQKNLQRLRRYVIQSYVVADMRFCDEVWNVNKMARYLNTNPTEVMIQVQKEITRISNFMGSNDNEAYARVLNFRAIKMSLDVQGIGTQQVEVLARAQGNKYVPFLTGALNQAIGNLTGILKTNIELYRATKEGAKMAPGINDDGKSGNMGTQYLTTDMALRLIENQPSIQDDPAYLEAIKKDIGELPDVCARNQDLSTIGIKLNKDILIPKVGAIPGIDIIPLTATQVARKADHTDRER